MDIYFHPDSPFKECIAQCDRYNRHAPKDPILITGETGTGKEAIARHIHFTGPQKNGPFMRINCANLPDSLFECERDTSHRL